MMASMLNRLYLWNFPAGPHVDLTTHSHSFVLKTCQRTIVLSYVDRPFSTTPLPLHEKAEGAEAYLYLLETICGLKSKLIGENEIVGQFKEAYKNFTLHPDRDSRLMLILEKLFKDAKEIRTQHLIGIGQKTYAHLTRKHFSGKIKQSPILILGSGQLAEDLINQFKKRQTIYLSARNSGRAEELAQQHKIELLPWREINWLEHAFIANTIGFEGTLLDENFFQAWKHRHTQRLLVDLGSPSAVQTTLTRQEGLIRLEDIFEEGALMEDQKRARIQQARKALLDIVDQRVAWLEEKQRRWQTGAHVELLA
jgi:glutamyl-tRNA reductase